MFSPDGRTMYFCSSKAEPIPSHYREIRYDICRIAFNPDSGTFGTKVDTLLKASAMGKSATHPRPSYDKGRLSKPFLLPQRNPWKYYSTMLDSFNTPDFTSRPVEMDNRAAGMAIMSDRRTETIVRK